MKYTVFTPTYNRKEELSTLYQSLKKQTFTQFEWLIIDDGSTDNSEQQIQEFIDENCVSIRYIRQNNGGKHRAFNKAIKEAAGEFVICVDSDDYLKDNAIEKIDEFSQASINLMAICFLCDDKEGKIIGDEFPDSKETYNLIDLTFKYKIRGDKLWVFKRDVLKKYKFPEYQDEKFVTEGVLLYEMAQEYDLLAINEPLQIHEYKEGGLTKIGNKKLFRANPKGARDYYKLLLSIAPNGKYKLYYLFNFILYSVYGWTKC